METEDRADFPDPLAYGVPFAHETAIDLAEPEVWRAWVCAEVTAARHAKWEAHQNKLRRQEEEARIAAATRRTKAYEAAEPFPWWERRAPFLLNSAPEIPSDPTGVRAAVDSVRNSPAGRAWRARNAAQKSLLSRLVAGALRAFARPENGREPWRWVAAHEWAGTEPLRDRTRPGAVSLGGLTYWQMHLFDPDGLPLDQAAMAYGAGNSSPLALARAAIGKHLLRAADRDQREENALGQLRQNLLQRLCAGTLLAFRGGAPLAPADFAPGAPLGNVAAWEGNADVLVRPLPLPRREAPEASPKDWRIGELQDWERREGWLEQRRTQERFLVVLMAMAAVAPRYLRPGGAMEFTLTAARLVLLALEHLREKGRAIDERAGERPWKVVEDKWNSRVKEANRKRKSR